jgi:hypothetical protein
MAIRAARRSTTRASARPIHADEWLAILASAPVTLDDTAEERAEFRQEVLDAAGGTKPLWANWIDGARQRQDGLALVEITPGWFRVEDQVAVAALKRILARAR